MNVIVQRGKLLGLKIDGLHKSVSEIVVVLNDALGAVEQKMCDERIEYDEH